MNGTEIATGLNGDLYIGPNGTLEIAQGLDLLRQDLLHILYEMPLNGIVGITRNKIETVRSRILNHIREELPKLNPIEPQQIQIDAKFTTNNTPHSISITIF